MEYISKSHYPVTISKLSRDLGIPKSSTYDILYTLTQKGFLDINDHDKSFQLGIKTFEVGSAFITKRDLSSVTRPFIEQLRQQTGETIFLAVENDGMIVYLDKAEGTSPIRTSCIIGERNLMHFTGLGKALLACYSTEKVRQITGGGTLPTPTKNSIPNFTELLKELEATRKRGYAIDNCENFDDLYCIASPIRDQNQDAIAAISIASLYSKMNPERHQYFSSLITKTAILISNRFGYTKDYLYLYQE